MTNNDALSSQRIAAAKEAVAYVGFGLGNLMYRFNKGEVRTKNGSWSPEHRKIVEGTKTFVLGGSIGTSGYTRELLPLLARKQLSVREPHLGESVQILSSPSRLDSADIGAIGSFFLPAARDVRDTVMRGTSRILARRRIPIVPLLDIGGSKINFVLAYVDKDGCLTLQVLRGHRMATPIGLKPEQFYARIASTVSSILQDLADTAFEVIPVMTVGQPGFFGEDGRIQAGSAKDLGSDFPGTNPSSILRKAMHEASGIEFQISTGNDGRAQFLGIVKASQKEHPWSAARGEKVAYLGLGTGLGAGFGKVVQSGEIELLELPNAFDITATEPSERIGPSEFCDKSALLNDPYEYGDLCSGKFFVKYLHEVELHRSRRAAPFMFLSESGLPELDSSTVVSFLESQDKRSPLSAILVNDLLKDQIVTSVTEQQIELRHELLATKLHDTLDAIAAELGDTLVSNVRSERSHYEAVTREVAKAKRRGRRVHFLGIGKSHSISQNLAYVYCNLGIDSAALELTGANSENLTTLREDDLVFLISNSGRASELLELIPHIRRKRCRTVALVGDPMSPMAKQCEFCINSHVEYNPHPISAAPTTSITSAMAAGTAIAMVVSYMFDYDARDFFEDHPNLQFNVEFNGFKADRSFDSLTKIEDIYRQFSRSIKELIGRDCESQILELTKRVLVSHYNGRTVFFTGAGSSLRVADKIAATLTSIGIDAATVNSAQLPHGDFAHIRPGDLLVIISYGGETRQLVRVRDIAIDKGVDCAAITADGDSSVARGLRLRVILGFRDDRHLVAIPDQKILSSFVNLTVGDILAVLLTHVGTMKVEEFGRIGHPGGEIGRTRGRFTKEFLEGLSGDRVQQLKAHPDDIAQECQRAAVRVNVTAPTLEHYGARKAFRNADSTGVMIFGMGAVGLAYLARLFHHNGKEIIFVEKNRELIDAMRRAKYTYKMVLCRSGARDDGRETSTVTGISVLPLDEQEAVIASSLRVDTVLTAIGVNEVDSLRDCICGMVRLRYAFCIEQPINFYFSENFPIEEDPLAKFRHEIRRSLNEPDVQVYFDEHVGLVPAIDEAIVPRISAQDLAQSIPVEREPPLLIVDRTRVKWRAADGPPKWTGVFFTEKFLPFHIRKLWIHNMAHAVIGYLGYARGHDLMFDAVSDSEVESCARGAMQAIGHELYRRWSDPVSGTPLDRYVDRRIEAYKNRGLLDSVERVCRDPLRKLGRNDRLVGPYRYIRKHGRDEDLAQADDILLGTVAALRYASQVQGEDYTALKAKVLHDLGVDSGHLAKIEARFEKLRKRKSTSRNAQPLRNPERKRSTFRR